jgi:hypothetical protein
LFTREPCSGHPLIPSTYLLAAEKMSAAAKELPTGFQGHLTESQTKALVELRVRIQNGEYAGDFSRDPGGDNLLLQFLRATMKDKGGERIFQIDAAETRLINTFKWRREFDLDEIRENALKGGPPPPKNDLFRKLYPSLDIINEKTGQFVRFLRFGRFISTTDVNALSVREWTQNFAAECFWLQDQLRQLSTKHGREISTYAVVSDLHGVSMLGVASRLSFIKMMSGVATDNFPEMMGRTLIIRGPWALPSIFNLVKPFIDKDIVSKFVLSNNLCTDEIAALIPLDSVPKEYGGTSDVVFPLVLHDAEKEAELKGTKS